MRLKHFAHVEMGQSPPSSDYSESPDIGLPFLQGTADFTDRFPQPQTYCVTPNKIAEPNDILLSVRAPVGELNIADRIYGIGRGLCAVRTGTTSTQNYLWWALHWARTQLSLEATGSTYEAVAVEDVSNLLIPVWNTASQTAIADYLDRKTAVIDDLLAEKQRLLEVLAEKRQALITQAVSRGLDPDVPLRDSGVEWLGEIPVHWEVGRLKAICESLQTGPFGSQLHASEYIDGGIPLVNPVHLVNGKIAPDSQVTVEQVTADRLIVHKLELGDVVLARRGEIGRCAAVTENEAGWLCGSGSMRVRPKASILNGEYLFFAISYTFAGQWLSIMSVGTTMDNLNGTIVGDLAIPLPPLQEQLEIVANLYSIQRDIDSLTQTTLETIALLQERRTALIAAAVTGQIEVTE